MDKESETKDAPKTASVNTVLQVTQLFAVVVGVGMILVNIGRRDADLDRAIQQVDELKTICSDLAKVTSGISVSMASHEAQLRAIEKRLELTEARR